jgi:hypothetical protein
MDPRVSYEIINKASPIADSAAAMVKIKREKICPKMSSKYKEKTAKLRFAHRSINSIPTRDFKTLLWFESVPIREIINSVQFIVI